MIKIRFRFSSAAVILCALLLSPSVSLAQKTTINIRMGDKTLPVPGYDSSGVVCISVSDYATALSWPFGISPERKKIEVRLPNDRVKATAGGPFLVVTELATSNSSVYQLSRNVVLLDSLYYAPAAEFVALLERLTPLGVSLDVETQTISKESVPPPSQFDLTGLSLETRRNGYLLTVKASRKLEDFDAFLNNGWLYVTVANATADTVAFNLFKSNEVIRRVLVFPSPTSVQLTFQVSPSVEQVDPMIDTQSNDLLLSLRTRTAVEKSEPPQNPNQNESQKPRTVHNRTRLDVIVIDAGHGGKDPGTIGVGGTREKDVALGVALKLGRLLEQKMEDVKVIYTRKSDTFVELYRRAQMANEANGKLFISIHCNSTERKPSSANGFEIYLLRPGKTDNAIRIAEQENQAIKFEQDQKRYQQLTEEYFILLTMRQSAYVRFSEEFAEKASEAMANMLKIQNSGVKQAGFYVLVGASMPNVLVETGYLSNRKEERVLKSADGQKKIAEALFEAVVQYKKKYEEAPQDSRSNDVDDK
jgi:N-acetylmuramoyl-L-alanine amidase